MMQRKIILDCDPGRDDALAIALALASPGEIDLLGITAVAGNVSVDITSRNARLIAEIAGFPDTRVYRGADEPLKAPRRDAARVHGITGLQGIEVYEPDLPLQPMSAHDFIKEMLSVADDDEITLVPTGPLTNIANVIETAPGVLSAVREIVLMGGGAREAGNVTPTAEFNIFADPHAADIVFRCGRPVTVISLDVTSKVLARPEHIGALEKQGTPIARALAALFTHDNASYTERYGTGVIPAHDPCTVAWLLWPDLFECVDVAVEVDTRDGPTFGMTIVDFWRKTSNPPNVRWVTRIDTEAFFERFIARIATLGGHA
ncbi:MAG: nucleoside hydrolase [Rhodospirillales bacterium]